MLVILDTNILLSGLISSHTPPYRIFWHWRAKGFDLVTCPEQLEEIRRVSRYPKFRRILQPHRVGQMMNFMQESTVVDDLRVTKEADDPFDSWLLALAEASHAHHHYLVTGDTRAGILGRISIGQAEILTAAQFCSRLGI